MAGVIFWDVDTQYDFMKADGKLYVPEAETIIPALQQLSDFAHARGIRVVASADDHVLDDPEISDTPDWHVTYPPHCMRGTPGQRRIAETTPRDPLIVDSAPADAAELAQRVRSHRGDIVIHKHTVDVFANPNTDTVIRALAPDAVVVYGVATDVCNRRAIEGFLERHPNIRLYAVTDAMRAIRAAAAAALLPAWQVRGVELVTTDDILSGRTALLPAETRT